MDALRQQIDAAAAEHAESLDLLKAKQEETIESLEASHGRAQRAAQDKYEQALEALKEEHAAELAELERSLTHRIETASTTHRNALARMEAAHTADLASALEDHSRRQELSSAEQSAARERHEVEAQSLRSAQDELSARLERVETQLQSKESALASAENERDQLAVRLDEVTRQLADATDSHEKEVSALQQKIRFQRTVSANSNGSSHRHEALAAIETLHGSLGAPSDSTLDSDANDSARELGRIRELVTKLDADLALALKERDGLAQQLARMSLSSASAALGPSLSRPMSPVGGIDEKLPLNLRAEQFLSNANRLPPPTPPPTMPPPPIPSGTSISVARLGGSHASTSTMSETSPSPASAPSNAVNAQESEARVRHTLPQISGSDTDGSLLQQLTQLQREVEQKEADLRALRNLANTLELALSDSERNLRKARQLTNDYARERDELRATSDRLRREADELHSASEKYRQSMVDMEERLAEQRRREARAERARIELEGRMSEVAKRKSKCERPSVLLFSRG